MQLATVVEKTNAYKHLPAKNSAANPFICRFKQPNKRNYELIKLISLNLARVSAYKKNLH